MSKKSFEVVNNNIKYDKCSMEEINRELKRLSSGKCRIGWDIKDGKRVGLNKIGKEIEERMKVLEGVKRDRFGVNVSGKWLNLSKEEIEELSFEDCMKGYNSIRSKISRYGKDKDSMMIYSMYKEVVDSKKKIIEFEKLKKELNM